MDDSDIGLPRKVIARRWKTPEGETLIRFKSSPSYNDRLPVVRDSDGVDEEASFLDSYQEIQVKPLFNFRPEISWPVRTFDLGARASCGYPKVAACAIAMHHALEVAGHSRSVLIQLWESVDGKDVARWQVEFKGQDSLSNLEHVQAMKTWAEAGAPIAFIARLTGNELARVRAMVRPAVQLEVAKGERKVTQRIGEVQW